MSSGYAGGAGVDGVPDSARDSEGADIPGMYDYALYGGEQPSEGGRGGRKVRTGPNGERITLLGQPHKTGIWTEAEDELLYMWQQRIGNKWAEVARHIPGKSGQQCAQRWRHRVNPDIKRDKWSTTEDALLVRLVEIYGNQWAVIARNVPGRTDQQCMGRWRRHLDPTIRRERWKQDEDLLLCALWNKYPKQWSHISKVISGRTAQQCRTRWKHIGQNMQSWFAQNLERINAIDVAAVELSMGIHVSDGARNTKELVKKQGEEIRERAAIMASAMPTPLDPATLEGQLVGEELEARELGGGLGVQGPPINVQSGQSARNIYNAGVKTDDLPLAREPISSSVGKGSSLPLKGKGSDGGTPSGMYNGSHGSKGSTPSAANLTNHAEYYDPEDDSYGNELESFKPVDPFKVLTEKEFKKPAPPKPLTVQSFQPAAALRLSEPQQAMRWEQPYLPNQIALQPFQPFKEFSPVTKFGGSYAVRPIGSNGTSILNEGRDTRVRETSRPYLQKRVELPVLSPRKVQPKGLTFVPSQSWQGHHSKRPRELMEISPNPDVEEERRLRELGGHTQKAREIVMKEVILREGAVAL